MNKTTLYAEIVKAERNADGDLVVVGKATGPDLDLDQQICDPAWLGKAMPAWFSTGGNIREQHSSIAAGVATDLAQDGDSWMVTSTIVDPVSAKKVEAGVLKGYSVGIKAPRVITDKAAPGGRIVDGQIVEVSLVDRPCNPTCTLSLAKAAKPGMSVKAADLDSEHMLVKVEEYAEHPDTEDREADAAKAADPEPAAEPHPAEAVIDAVKALGVDLAKESPDEDIASAQEAIAIIGRIIVSEAQSLASGQLNEACDIDELLCAVRALKWFMCMEAEEETSPAAPTDDEMVTIPLAAEPDTPKTPEPDAVKAAGPDIAELVKTAVTEATKAHEEELKALRAEVAKVRELPVPGGPVLTRTAEDTKKAAAHDAQLVKATEFRRLADQVTDPKARRGYLDLAAQIELELA